MRHRIRLPGAREAIGHALHIVEGFRDAIGPVEWFVGADPVFAGLHNNTDISDGRSYRDTGHVCYPCHLENAPADRRCTTVVMPTLMPVVHIVHELGHVLDWRMGFTHTADPVTEYAESNREEAFAEAFTARFYRYGDQDAAATDLATIALFDSLDAPT